MKPQNVKLTFGCPKRKRVTKRVAPRKHIQSCRRKYGCKWCGGEGGWDCFEIGAPKRGKPMVAQTEAKQTEKGSLNKTDTQMIKTKVPKPGRCLGFGMEPTKPPNVTPPKTLFCFQRPPCPAHAWSRSPETPGGRRQRPRRSRRSRRRRRTWQRGAPWGRPARSAWGRPAPGRSGSPASPESQNMCSFVPRLVGFFFAPLTWEKKIGLS